MITNPNTLGMFEEHLEEVVNLVHGCGGLMYGDGANMNALVGIAQPGDIGFDVMHYNLHKTFSTPHGGGGPGSGPVGVTESLADFLPGPIVNVFPDDEDETPHGCAGLRDHRAHEAPFTAILACWCAPTPTSACTAGRFEGQLDVCGVERQLRAGVNERQVSAAARIASACTKPAPGQVRQREVNALDVSKRLMDYDFHPPTNYFPLIVPEALLIEPTESESKQTLDQFIDAMRRSRTKR